MTETQSNHVLNSDVASRSATMERDGANGSATMEWPEKECTGRRSGTQSGNKKSNRFLESHGFSFLGLALFRFLGLALVAWGANEARSPQSAQAGARIRSRKTLADYT